MTWNDFYRRRDIIDSVLRHQAGRDPQAPLPFAGIAGARDAFGSEENLLLALHYKWTQQLSGHLRTELLGDTDHVEAATRAWHKAARGNRTLRAVLDANLGRYPSLRAVQESEQRMLAITAGLADPGAPAAEITRVGAALETLLRSGREVWPSRNAMGQFRRMLAPSA